MADSKNGVSLRAKVLSQLKELETIVLELLDDAEAGRQIRQMFQGSAPTSTPAVRAKPAPAPARPKKSNKRKSSASTNAAGDEAPSAGSEIAEKIVSVLGSAKKGLKARELKEQLPEITAGALTYQLEKLIKTGKLRKRGKTSKTTYLLAPA